MEYLNQNNIIDSNKQIINLKNYELFKKKVGIDHSNTKNQGNRTEISCQH